MPLETGTKLGPYEIVEPLGSGGMGEVYRARDPRFGRDVAVKVVKERLADPERSRRFQHEARAAGALNHPNVMTAHDVGTHEGRPYLVTELLQGRSFREVLGDSPLPVSTATGYAIQIAGGLAAAHAEGIVHRDLKPENLFLTRDGVVKILDFGLAKVLREERVLDSEQETVATESHTVPGKILGTLRYMAPEQIRGEPVDRRTDIFALGVVLYEMLSGRRPFSGDARADTMAAILTKDPPQLGAGNVPAALARIVERCLSKRPEDRFDSARDLALALDAGASESAAPALPRHWTAHPLLVMALVALLLTFASVWIGNDSQPAAPATRAATAATVRALAVLPLRNLSGDPEQEYFADGLTESLINDLAKIESLKVISRTSAMRFKNSDAPLSEVARALGVDAVIEGSALRVENRVRITAQLIQPDTEEVLWADSYDRDLSDVLRLQGEVARAVARRIEIALTPEAERLLSGVQAVVPEAHEAVLQGDFLVRRLTPGDQKRALEYFELALEKDPDNARAYLSIKRAWGARSVLGLVPPREADEIQEVALAKALELDPTLAEAHSELAKFRTWSEFDWSGADVAFRRALDLNPSMAETRAFYAHFLTSLGREAEADRQMRRALELDPLNTLIQSLHGIRLQFAGRYEEAVVQLRKTVAVAPESALPHLGLWGSLQKLGRLDEAFVAAKAYAAAVGNEPFAEALERGYAAEGYEGAMRASAETLEARARTTYVKPMIVAWLFGSAGQTDRAFEWMEKAYELRDHDLAYLSVMPVSDRIRDDTRFGEMLRRMKLPALRR